MKKLAATAIAVATLFPAASMAANPLMSFTRLWSHDHSATVDQTSEIAAFDKRTNTLWVAGVVGVDVLDAATGALVDHIDVTPYGAINSVAIHNGLAALAVESGADRRTPGFVLFYDTKTRQPSEGVSEVVVGALPDMLTFTPDGTKLLVANEATPNPEADSDYEEPDPAGSVSIIDMASRSVIATAGFDGVPLTGANVRTKARVGMDFEPEYIAVDQDSAMAYVTLQEANAVGVLDLATHQFTRVMGLGLKDFNLPGNEIDPSDRDGETRLRRVAVKGLYQPDAIATYQVAGETYLVTANEGDTREDDGDKARVKDVPGLSADPDVQRMNISTVDSTPGNLVTFGSRSFSIRDSAGNLVYDSGNILDAQAIAHGIYDDGRSDDKGMEPEGVTLLDIGGHTYAFIGLERTKTAAVAIFDITDPRNAQYVDMIATGGDIAPEGLIAYHHKGDFYLAIANEVSKTTTLYRLDRRQPIVQ